MTLGRTSSGAIQIKTDGGLRAVNCGCCGGGCEITEAQFNSIRNGGTYNIAYVGTDTGVATGTFGQDYEYSYTDAAATTIVGSISGGAYGNVDGPEIQCLYTAPPPYSFTYPMPLTPQRIEYVSFNAYYTAILPNDGSPSSYFLSVAYGEAGGECTTCDSSIPDSSTTTSLFYANAAGTCGDEFYRWFMEGDTALFSVNTAPPANCP